MKHRVIHKMRCAVMVDEAGREALYVRVQDCGIPWLVIMLDHLPLAVTKKPRKAYWMRVTDAIKWYERESTFVSMDHQGQVAHETMSDKKDYQKYQRNIARLRDLIAEMGVAA